MTYRVAIPSYARPATLTEKTLPLLLNHNVPQSHIDVHVIPDQTSDYEKALAPYPGVTLVTHDVPRGMMNARNAITRHYPTGTRLVQIDDDVTRIVQRIDDKTLVDVTDLDELFTIAFDLTDRAHLSLWGVYPVKNPYFMKARVRTDLTYIEGALFGYTVKTDETELVTCDDKEDFERSIRFYQRDGGVLRIESISMVTKFYTEPGGMQTYRTPETIETGARYLATNYADYCTYRISRKGNPELRLRDKTITP